MGFASPRRRVDFAAQILVDESARALSATPLMGLVWRP
jgi:hypothetical protein